jgi:hypothetical protein
MRPPVQNYPGSSWLLPSHPLRRGLDARVFSFERLEKRTPRKKEQGGKPCSKIVSTLFSRKFD